MNTQPSYDVAIIGGGLGGLALAIQLAKKKYSVVLFEKENFPFHKVCGEYISLESRGFIESLGIPLSTMDLPIVKQLELTAPGGGIVRSKLPLGGFGISRHLLDAMLADRARECGVDVREGTRVLSVAREGVFRMRFKSATEGAEQEVTARLCCAAYGKRSNLDVKWNRPFVRQRNDDRHNYVGIKYHVQTNWPKDYIGLHNFEGGYCGISRIEGDRYCLCYMTTATNLKRYKGDVPQMEREVLYKNPHLKKILQSCTVVSPFPISISQINFDKKAPVENGVLMIGDAAGTIPPLCGNGMSMALHSSKLAAPLAAAYLDGTLSREEMEKQYTRVWNRQFSRRLYAGRLIQRFFGRSWLTNGFVALFRIFPFLSSFAIRQTHGKPY